ncbi:MAG: histidinol-phosphate transaminase [Muribaculum sp.]|nr:histidinol-phosphate transaminase [Muribaculaceae bacterium]MCM1081740.1 histidinol-phosphate transaminase [Muribaculum sp.]
MTLKELTRPNIWSLKPYTCARDEFKGEARAWLDANENSIIEGLNRYPDPLQWAVKEQLSAVMAVPVENIFLGVGSDECIDMCYRVFCRPGVDNVVAIEPTYGMYGVCADINDVEYRRVPLNADFSLNVEALLGAADENTKVLWICSPNNPTANAFPLTQLREVASRFRGITVVDEAYVDFSDKGSMAEFLSEFPRMIVMRTFSKAWAAAAMRLGIAFASTEIIGLFNKVKYPYNINILTQREALKILADRNHVAEVAAEIVRKRRWLEAELDKLPIVDKVYPSDANFLLVKLSDADATEVYNRLCSEGVVVRNRSRVALCGNCLRITVGNDEENQLLLSCLKK